MSTKDTILTIIGSLGGGAVIAKVAENSLQKRFKGRIKYTDAEVLWREQDAWRTELKERIAQQALLIEELKQENAHLRTEIIQDRTIIQALKYEVEDLKQQIVRLTGDN